MAAHEHLQPPDANQKPAVLETELLIAQILRLGVIVSFVIIFVGIAATLLTGQTGYQDVRLDDINTLVGYHPGRPNFPDSFGAILTGLLAAKPYAIIALGLVAATAGYLAVFSLNDVLDRRVDADALRAGKGDVIGYDIDTAFERHPLARGDISFAWSLMWVGSLGVVSAVCAYLLAPVCLGLFVVAVALEVVYCSLRQVTWLKTIVSGLMVGVGGLAGWAAVAPITGRAVPFFCFLALWEIGGRNLPNDLSDIVADSAVGIRTVATTFGSRASAVATATVAAATFASLVALGLSCRTMLFSAGRYTRTEVPEPGSLEMATPPPWLLTIPYTQASPRPRWPPSFFVVKNGSKMRGSSSTGMPVPVSLTSTQT